MRWDDVGIKNIVHIHPPAPHLTFEPTSHIADVAEWLDQRFK